MYTYNTQASLHAWACFDHQTKVIIIIRNLIASSKFLFILLSSYVYYVLYAFEPCAKTSLCMLIYYVLEL